MSIHYAATVEDSGLGGKRKSPALNKLALIAESFQSQGINVLNEGFGEVAVSTHFFRDYTSQLTEDMSPECTEQFEVLAENVRREVLVESNISGMSAVTALSLPLLRIAFPKTSVREGLPTEPVTQPKFTVKWFRPYVVVSNGVKQYLPKALRDVNTQGLFHLPKLDAAIALTAGQAINYDLFTTVGSRTLNDQIDPNFSIVAVTGKIATATVAGTTDVPVTFKIDTLTNVCEGLVTLVGTTETMEARIFAKVNRETGYADIITAVTTVKNTSTGIARTVVPADDAITSIKIEGYLSSEMNNRAAQIGFEITDDPTTIGTGQPIESPINIQQMTDAMAMYNIDTTMRHLEIMSTTLAQVVDIEGVGFIVNQFGKVPAPLGGPVGVGTGFYTEEFNRTPAGGYALGPTAWREELKIQIDSLVVKMMNETNYTSGSVVLFGNPIDIQVINNVRWTYSSEEAPNGVNVDYRLGVYTSGVTTFKVLSSFNWPACSAGGYIYVVFIPNEQDQKTVAYYPYSYHVLRGQASPNNVNLPSIQMIKRQAFREYTPMIGRIKIT